MLNNFKFKTFNPKRIAKYTIVLNGRLSFVLHNNYTYEKYIKKKLVNLRIFYKNLWILVDDEVYCKMRKYLEIKQFELLSIAIS